MPGAQCTRSLVRAKELSMRTSIHSGGTGPCDCRAKDPITNNRPITIP
jgi:hypothetical protein